MTLLLETQKHSSTTDTRRCAGCLRSCGMVLGATLDTKHAFGKCSMLEQALRFSFLHSSAACAQEPSGLKGGRGKIKTNQDLASPARWSQLSLTFSVCSVFSCKMPEASLRCVLCLFFSSSVSEGKGAPRSFPSIADKMPETTHGTRGKLYLGPQFQRSQSAISWPIGWA